MFNRFSGNKLSFESLSISLWFKLICVRLNKLEVSLIPMYFVVRKSNVSLWNSMNKMFGKSIKNYFKLLVSFESVTFDWIRQVRPIVFSRLSRCLINHDMFVGKNLNAFIMNLVEVCEKAQKSLVGNNKPLTSNLNSLFVKLLPILARFIEVEKKNFWIGKFRLKAWNSCRNHTYCKQRWEIFWNFNPNLFH